MLGRISRCSRILEWALVICFAGGVIACSERHRESSEIRPLDFEVVDSLVSWPVTLREEGIAYRFPVEWTKIPVNVLADAKNAWKPGLDIRVTAAYVDPSKSSYFVVSQLDSGAQPFLRKFMIQYAQEFVENHPAADTFTTVFSRGEFLVHQFLGVSPGPVLLRLIFSSSVLHSPIQFDFIVPRSRYFERLKQIESVIGSISLQSTHH